MENKIEGDRRIEKTKEQKTAEREAKKQEKLKRKEKALSKGNEDTKSIPIGNKPICNENLENIKNPKSPKNKIIVRQPLNQEFCEKRTSRIKSSDRVSFSESNKDLDYTKKPLDKEKKESTRLSRHKLTRIEVKKKLNWINHLFIPDKNIDFINLIRTNPNSKIHKSIVLLAQQWESREINSATVCCRKFLEALKQFTLDLEIKDDENFSHKFNKEFKRQIEFLKLCRPIPMTVQTVIGYLNSNLSGLLGEHDNDKCKEVIKDMLCEFEHERIKMAHKTIETMASKYIHKGYSILIYGQSELVLKSLIHAKKTCEFTVYIVDSWPDNDSQQMMSSLIESGLSKSQCHLIDLDSICSNFPFIDLVLLGAYSVHSNSSRGCILNLAGSASIAQLASQEYFIPVVVCAETCKFNREVNMGLDALSCCNNEVDTTGLNRFIQDEEVCHQIRDINSRIYALNLLYDVIPYSHVSVICCELGTIAPTAVAHVIQMKQP